MGTIELDQLDKTWLPYIDSLKEGQISKPFRVASANAYGFQILLLRKRTPAHVMTLDTDYPKLESLAMNFRRNKDYLAWMAELRKTIYWKINQ